VAGDRHHGGNRHSVCVAGAKSLAVIHESGKALIGLAIGDGLGVADICNEAIESHRRYSVGWASALTDRRQLIGVGGL
jgi:hypothetical protein